MTYRPAYFRIDDRTTLLELIARYPFASLICPSAQDVTVTHVPFFARESEGMLFLEGHIARANDQWKIASEDALVTFVIANHYISPSWYPSKRVDPRTVPTWDYVAVHARGAVRFVHDRSWLRTLVARSSEQQERAVGGTWSIDDAPSEYIDRQLEAIVGVEVRVHELTGTFKLNQNHPPENVACVIDALVALGTPNATKLASFFTDPRS